jgi:hypothetical protein
LGKESIKRTENAAPFLRGSGQAPGLAKTVTRVLQGEGPMSDVIVAGFIGTSFRVLRLALASFDISARLRRASAQDERNWWSGHLRSPEGELRLRTNGIGGVAISARLRRAPAQDERIERTWAAMADILLECRLV